MQALLRILFLCLLTSALQAQIFVSPLADMPEPVSNNAVTQARVNGNLYVYSFAGIDESKDHSGIHKKAWRYSVADDQWESIAPLPLGLERIAAGASTVKNKIYIIGGYHVFSTGAEVSLDHVHIYNPETNSYEADGTPCPVPTDDHVQAVWRDSLIYVISGWSNSGNIPTVQIYNPTEDSWAFGTSVPNTADYEAFGASGIIIDDVIYYIGGATDLCCNPVFPAAPFLRIGQINPDDPTDISWSVVQDPLATRYRGILLEDSYGTLVSLFGSSLTYNYDGIDYNGSGGVEPDTVPVHFGTADPADMEVLFTTDFSLMDLRGYGDLGNAKYILAGGMLAGQEVSNKTWLVEPEQTVDTKEIDKLSVSIFPNPVSDQVFVAPFGEYAFKVVGLDGSVLMHKTDFSSAPLDVSALASGIYYLQILNRSGQSVAKKMVIP
ncbi:MAG: T9SS type A sorting domain-containing protein [Bacteroidetes bacterium]|nr:T9SS type A sorting domain-containing protein [Bacteroidota bacterium]